VEVGRRLYARGLIGGHEGNVSVRLDSTLLITPAGVCKGFMTPDMIVRTDLEGRPVDGGRASTEILMHTAVYRRRGDVRAVVHAHPPTATGFAVAGVALDRPLLAEAVFTLGPVPVIPYALLMANHGALAVGDTLERAWERMETLEQLARITLVTRILGQDHALPGTEVGALREAAARGGYPPPVCAPGAPPPVRPLPSTRAGTSVTLSETELVRLITDAVERFRT
jgi:L-fuculose-phosphate aldolase